MSVQQSKHEIKPEVLFFRAYIYNRGGITLHKNEELLESLTIIFLKRLK